MARSMAAPGVIIVICLFLFWQTASMRSAYAADELFGPAFFPRVVLGGLLVVSVMQMVQQLARRAAAAEETPPPMDAAAFAVTLAAAAA